MAADARAIVDLLLPEPDSRAVVLHYYGEVLRIADAVEPGSWAVTMRSNYIALNAGRAFVFGIVPGGVRAALDELAGARSNDVIRWGRLSPFGLKTIPELVLLDVPAVDLARAWPDLRSL